MKRVTIIKRLIIVMVLGGLILGGVLWLRSGDKTSIGHTVTFSDGTTLTLRAVTYGTEHRHPGDTAWERFLFKLPRKLVEKFGLSSNTTTSSTPHFTFWLERRGAGPTNGPGRITLRDAQGFEFGNVDHIRSSQNRGNGLEGWVFSEWPRRAKTFTLCIYEEGRVFWAADRIGEFTVQNPAPTEYPVWIAAPPPVPARSGDLSVTLFDLTAGVGRDELIWKSAPDPTKSQARAGFRVEQNGRPTSDWKICRMEVSDATGNQIAEEWFNSRSEPDGEYAALWRHPWPPESAWKLRVGLTRRTNFDPTELWTLHVPVPGTHFTNRTMQTNLQGALVEYTGPQSQMLLLGRLGSAEQPVYLNFHISPARTNFQLTLVSVIDDAGRRLEVSGSLLSQSYPAFGLRAHPNVTNLDVTVALHETRYFDFLVKPLVISTNEPSHRVSPKSK